MPCSPLASLCAPADCSSAGTLMPRGGPGDSHEEAHLARALRGNLTPCYAAPFARPPPPRESVQWLRPQPQCVQTSPCCNAPPEITCLYPRNS
eukprot:CAMPEP_0174943504 /NCGR_PEP_ID=MMETSP1355-20121228/76854_1 /TAXON_ID=464990 /ORGANISM="Hemiselmis tepida, Strain CCMP443" /LENGTH=92 /DNA_ID=CAMNT_0016190755 /DNA_START=44 /DNA_END=322 /DNA_ORIENTATION=+